MAGASDKVDHRGTHAGQRERSTFFARNGFLCSLPLFTPFPVSFHFHGPATTRTKCVAQRSRLLKSRKPPCRPELDIHPSEQGVPQVPTRENMRLQCGRGKRFYGEGNEKGGQPIKSTARNRAERKGLPVATSPPSQAHYVSINSSKSLSSSCFGSTLQYLPHLL